MGLLFTYVAIQNVNQSGWNIVALLFTFIAALDFGLGIRYLQQRNGKGQ